MTIRRLGFIAALLAAFAAGSNSGVRYAKKHYVARDRKFIEGKVVKDKSA
jgi:hypothetical protein